MKKIITISGFVFLGILGAFNSFGQKAEIAIIINSSNSIETLAITEVKNYWLRRSKARWPQSNKNIVPVGRKSKCAERDLFYSNVLFLSEDDVEAYITAKQYQSGLSPIANFSSDKEIIEFVKKEPGSIAFVNSASITGDMEGIKVIRKIVH